MCLHVQVWVCVYLDTQTCCVPLYMPKRVLVSVYIYVHTFVCMHACDILHVLALCRTSAFARALWRS